MAERNEKPEYLVITNTLHPYQTHNIPILSLLPGTTYRFRYESPFFLMDRDETNALPGKFGLLVLREFSRGTLENMHDIDRTIQEASTNWKVERMPVIDRNILRLAVYELSAMDTPKRVVLNEAIELAKKYGSIDSGRFVNGLLDKIVQDVQQAIPP